MTWVQPVSTEADEISALTAELRTIVGENEQLRTTLRLTTASLRSANQVLLLQADVLEALQAANEAKDSDIQHLHAQISDLTAGVIFEPGVTS